MYTLVISICWMTIVWEISTMTGSTASMPDERKSDSSNVPQNWTKNVHFARTIVYAGVAASEIVIIMKRQVCIRITCAKAIKCFSMHVEKKLQRLGNKSPGDNATGG